MRLWGFKIEREGDDIATPTPIQPENNDGAVVIDAPSVGYYVDLDASYRSELDLLSKYRQMSLQPEMENAISDIIDEAIVHDKDGDVLRMNLDKLDHKVCPDKIKKMILDEFRAVVNLLDFNNFGDEIFRKWYIDGRLYYNVVIDQKNPRNGIQTLVYIDSRKIKKVRQVMKARDDKGAEIITGVEEFYIYNDKLMMNNPNAGKPQFESSTANGVRLSKDSVVQVTSGIYDPIKGTVLSYLHKAIRPMNQLRFVEDATVIYRVTRAPERRVFYIGTGGMNKTKAEQFLKDMMTKFRNKLNYDPVSGEVKDDRRHIAMLEDFWIPRREGDKTTEITQLQGGQSLGQMDDVMYFQKQLYRALGIPASRIENPASLFSIGESGQISRDEIKFDKAIARLRSRFSLLFDELMERQLALKGVCTVEEWRQFKQDIYYEFHTDNNYVELKDSQLLNMRADTMTKLQPYVGIYFSKLWVQKKVWRMDDDDIEIETTQMEKERQAAEKEEHPPLAGYPPLTPPGAPLPDENLGMNGPEGEDSNGTAGKTKGKTKEKDDLNNTTQKFMSGEQ
jgi:hypothetical protein